MDNTAFRLRNARASFSPLTTYVHLKDLGSATVLPVDVAEFWRDPGARPELASGRILMGWRVEEDLPHWEMHPAGDELLIAQSGAFELVLQDGRVEHVVPLAAGEVALVPFGIWHRLKVQTPGEILFVTPGKGTQHRPL
ncbi:MAG TPA: cupin domain-containing protein [Planctomycetota bacterium]